MITNNGEPKPHPLGTDSHDESFEGSNKLYAEHLMKDHGFSYSNVEPFKDSLMQGAWIALNKLHRHARSQDN
jgi:hypothetical protein